MEVFTIKKICDLINNIFPKNINIKDYNSAAFDLTNEIDKK